MNKKLQQLRARMEAEQIDYYLIPTEDYHSSEYVGDYFKCREYITGFTGSAGTALVWMDGAGLWTDGRYFLQAEEQLAGSEFTLFKVGTEGTPDILQFLEENVEKGEQIAADGRVISAAYAKQLEKTAKKCHAFFKATGDLIDDFWLDRPKRSCEPIWFPDKRVAGETREEKLIRVRGQMEERGVELLVLSALDEISWLFNLRGGDIACCPMPLCYAVIGRKRAVLYLQTVCWTEELLSWKNENIVIHPYDTVYEELASLAKGKKVWADRESLNQALWEQLATAEKVMDRTSPVIAMKACKNRAEQEGFRQAQLFDGAAVTRFQFWLKEHVEKETITEISAAERLEEFRKECPSYLMPSFDPIVAYQEHGAIVHYSATQESDRELKPEGFLLMDTGGHYREGTTDITRTIVLGALTEKQKEHYTRVLIGNLRLAASKFLWGCSGESLDVIARIPLWEAGLNFNHGTGHGVGWLMNVHEGPQAIRWKHTKGKDAAILEAGMILSDEPGVYLEGQYGIRLENLLLCREWKKTEDERWMKWETLTLVPFEREAVLVSLLEAGDRQLLNEYHRKVREKLLPFMKSEEEKRSLLQATEKI